MAMTFNGSSDYLTIASDLGIDTNVNTMALRFNPASLANNVVLLRQYTPSPLSERYLQHGGHLAGDPIIYVVNHFGAASDTITNTPASISTGVWYAISGRQNSATSRTNRFETTNVNGSAASAVPTTTTSEIGRYTSSNYFAGDLADIAFWRVGLSDAECNALLAGFPAHRVRPQSLISSVRLIRDGRDRKGHVWTVGGSPAASAHPRSYGA